MAISIRCCRSCPSPAHIIKAVTAAGISSLGFACGGIAGAFLALGAYAAARRKLTASNVILNPAVMRGEPSYTIVGNPRAGNPKSINIPIANVSHLRLTDKNLPEIFRLANTHTLNQPYPIHSFEFLKYNEQMLYRPNHNGTHSARQVAHLDALFDLILQKGSRTAQDAYNRLTADEKLNLRLAAYFLRAGRVDESNHKDFQPDDYYTRSALIYEQYARQLGVRPATIDWIKKLIVNSCKPIGIRDPDIDSHPKNKFGYEVLTMVHEMDLVRCFYDMDHTMESMRERLDYFISDRYGCNRDAYKDQLIQHAKVLCSATGSQCSFEYDPGNIDLFAECSTRGDFCWQAVKSLKFPNWI